MVNLYIKYKRDMVENPPRDNSLVQLLVVYGIWLVFGDKLFDWLRAEIIAPRIASGEWQEDSVPRFLRPEKIAEAAESLGQTVSNQVDAVVSTASNAISSTVDAVSTSADAAQATIDAASNSL